MRTTVSIDDHILAAAKSAARFRGATLGQLVESALRRELAAPIPASPPEIPVFTNGAGARLGVDLRSNRALAELLDTDSQ